jgi:hypothetical protein
MSDTFEVTYEVEDGYVTGDRPQTVSISADAFYAETSEKELKKLFWEEINDHFSSNISPVCDQESEFIAWAKERQAEMRKEE